MRIVNDLDEAAIGYWSDYGPSLITMRAPAAMPDCADCSAVRTITTDGLVVRVAWKPDAADLELLNAGGTVWLSMWGGLAPHQLEVQAPVDPPIPVDAESAMSLMVSFEFDPGGDAELTDEAIEAFVGQVVPFTWFGQEAGRLRITHARRRDRKPRSAWISGEVLPRDGQASEPQR